MKNRKEMSDIVYMWSGYDDGTFHNTGESVEDCIELAKDDGCDSVFIGETVKPNIDLSLFGHTIADGIGEQLYDIVGDVSENFNPTAEQMKTLGKDLEPIIKSWLDNIGGYKCVRVINIRCYDTKTESDESRT